MGLLMAYFNKVLVTGGAGFIGHRLVERLAQAGAQVAVIDNLFSGMPMPAASSQVKPYPEDIRNVPAVDSIIREFAPELVVHLAAVHHIPTCERDPHLAMDVNVLGTQSVLNACEKNGVKRLIIASSSAVYDWWETALIEDQTPILASDVYSTTKITNEHQAKIWAERTGGRVGIARIFNVIGHDDPNGHIIPDILNQIKTCAPGESPVIGLGNTAPKRDYTHADDTADGLLSMSRHLEIGNAVEAYNISYGEEFSVIDLVKTIGDYMGTPITITHDPSRVRRVDRLHLLGDSTKTKRVLGWQAAIPFTEALNRILSQLAPR